MVELTERSDGGMVTRFLATKLDARWLAAEGVSTTRIQPTHLIARESENHESAVFVFVIQGLETYGWVVVRPSDRREWITGISLTGVLRSEPAVITKLSVSTSLPLVGLRIPLRSDVDDKDDFAFQLFEIVGLAARKICFEVVEGGSSCRHRLL